MVSFSTTAHSSVVFSFLVVVILLIGGNEMYYLYKYAIKTIMYTEMSPFAVGRMMKYWNLINLPK